MTSIPTVSSLLSKLYALASYEASLRDRTSTLPPLQSRAVVERRRDLLRALALAERADYRETGMPV